MPAPGIIGFDQIGDADKPSPSIWGNCPNTLLNDKGLGTFVRENFNVPFLSATPADTSPVGALTFKGDTDTSLTTTTGTPTGIIDIETDTTAGDAGVLVTNAFGRIVKHSGEKLWFEARVAPGDVDDDMGTFIGLCQESIADEDIIADDPATNASTANGTLIGFFQNNADPNAYNALNKKTTGTAVEVLADVTNATAIPLASRASLIDGVAATGAGFHKLGLYFDGNATLKFYVDGYHVATQAVDTTVDQSNYLSAIVAVKTGDAAAEKIFCDWFQYGYQTTS